MNIQLRFEGEVFGELRIDGKKLTKFIPIWEAESDELIEEADEDAQLEFNFNKSRDIFDSYPPPQIVYTPFKKEM